MDDSSDVEDDEAGSPLPQSDSGLNQRLITVQSWWLASELIRRHPELNLIETHPGGGMYDCLTIIDPLRPGNPLVQLNRVGSLHAGEHTGLMTWETERAFDDRHEAVRRLEKAAGLKASPAQSSTPKVLTYRTIARVLAGLINERHEWSAWNYCLDSSEFGAGDASFSLDDFPTAAEAVRLVRPDDLYGLPGYRYWGLFRGEELMAVLDTDGWVHLKSERVGLAMAYAKQRNLTLAIASVLGSVLP